MNARRLPGGVNDLVPLTDDGVRDAERAANQLEAANIHRVVSSPMTRALQTAAVISARLAVPLSVDFDLREWLVDDTYRWDAAAAEAAYRDFIACRGRWPDGERRGWEPLASVRARARAAIDRHVDGDDTAAIVCHGVVIYCLSGLDNVPTGGIVLYR